GGQIKEYLGDIDEMLSRKGLENLDSLDLRAASKAAEPVPEQAKPVVSDKDLRQWQRRFANVEKEIQGLEQWLKEKEIQLADPEIYSSPNFQNHVKEYESKKEKLAAFMEEWEALAEK